MAITPPQGPNTERTHGDDGIFSSAQVLICCVLLGLTIAVYVSQGGFGSDFRQLTPEFIAYGLASAAGAAGLVFAAAVIGSMVAAITKRPKRIIGWVILFVASVLIMYVALWIIPPFQVFR